MSRSVFKARRAEDVDAARRLVWEFFETLRARYPDMLLEIDAYIEDQAVAAQLDRFREHFMPPNGECLLARHDDAIVGLVMLKPRGDGDGEMNRMYVRGSARGLGLGRMLGRAAIAEARALGYGTLHLGALNRHVEALPLYESLGFSRYAEAAAPGDERVIHMRLRL